jgi:hypothetical protein
MYNAGLINGMAYGDNNVTVPNIDIGTCGANVVHSTVSLDANTTFGSVNSDALSGTVRITTTAAGTKSMILPATALDNFTQDDINQTILWSVGEYASLADRNIEANATSYAAYNEARVNDDAAQLAVNEINMAYSSADEAVQVLVTQPYKRVVVQLGDDEDNVYTNESTITPANMYADLNDCSDYGYLTVSARPYDLKETTENATTPGGLFISPITTDSPTADTRCKELMTLTKEKTGATGDTGLIESTGWGDVDKTNGHIDVTGTFRGIVTQMSGSTGTGTAQTNWFYAPAK